MKTKTGVLLIIVSALFFNVNVAFSQKSAELKYKLKKGEKYNFSTNVDMDMTFEAGGNTATMESVMDIYMTSTILNVENDVINQDFVFDRIAMNQKIFGMEINYDSDDTSTYNSGMGAKVGQEMNKIIGQSIVMSMDDRGNIIDLDLSGIDNTDITNNITSGNTYTVYPDHKVKVGDTWESDINPIKGGDMKVHVNYKLVKLSKKSATIEVKGSITANEVKGEEINMNGTTEGEMIVNVKTGILISSKIDLDMTMDIEQNGTKFPATLLSTSTTTVKKVK